MGTKELLANAKLIYYTRPLLLGTVLLARGMASERQWPLSQCPIDTLRSLCTPMPELIAKNDGRQTLKHDAHDISIREGKFRTWRKTRSDIWHWGTTGLERSRRASSSSINFSPVTIRLSSGTRIVDASTKVAWLRSKADALHLVTYH
jgi:hypothetical protein